MCVANLPPHHDGKKGEAAYTILRPGFYAAMRFRQRDLTLSGAFWGITLSTFVRYGLFLLPLDQ